MQSESQISGIAASPGVALAKALIYHEDYIQAPARIISDANAEIERFKKTLNISVSELLELAETTRKECGDQEAEIFEAHAMILQDPEIEGPCIELIKKDEICAEFAFQKICLKYRTLLEGMDNDYFRERAVDVTDVSQRVVKHLMNIPLVDFANLDDEVILIANDLTPSVTASMDKNKIKGILTQKGGKTSHSAILARNLNIPAIVGIEDLILKIKSSDHIALDATLGKVYINPSKLLTGELQDKIEYLEKEKIELKAYLNKPSTTIDGHQIKICANIAGPQDLPLLEENGAEGVGLFRTEFLFMDRQNFPTEEEQFLAYEKVLVSLNNKPVVIRTLDIGGDKELPYFDLPKELNPFLGVRAIRLCLKEKELFKIQLKAILRAGASGNLYLMIPMITNLDELKQTKLLIKECQEELEQRNEKYAKNFKLGIMIEVPSAAMMADILAKEVDFFSIGTNDLIQYTTASDRLNEALQDLGDINNPGVKRLIQCVAQAAKKAGISCKVCGEAAADPNNTEFFVSAGVTELSMNPSSVLRVRKKISEINFKEISLSHNQDNPWVTN
jgi:phosphotransferase system enzyme I (PtsI)